MEWQTIDTAPIEPFDKDKWYMRHSPYILVWDGHNVCIASYHYTKKGKGRWMSEGRIMEGFYVTHWMPLPEGPKK